VLDGAADGDGPFSTQLSAVQLEEAFAQVLAAGSGEAAFPGDVFALGGAELVVCGWLGGCTGEVFWAGFIACAVWEEVSGGWEDAFDGSVTGCVALGGKRDFDEFGGLRADFGTRSSGGECSCIETLCLT